MGQVAVGNELLLFSIDLLICLARSDGLGVLEHPGEPADESKPSIWRLPIVQLLGQLPGFEFVDFAQGASRSEVSEAYSLPHPYHGQSASFFAQSSLVP